MQEEVENRTLTLVVSGTKFTGRMFKAAIPQRAFRSISQNAPTEQSQQKKTQLIVGLAVLECESIRILAGNGMV